MSLPILHPHNLKINRKRMTLPDQKILQPPNRIPKLAPSHLPNVFSSLPENTNGHIPFSVLVWQTAFRDRTVPGDVDEGVDEVVGFREDFSHGALVESFSRVLGVGYV